MGNEVAELKKKNDLLEKEIVTIKKENDSLILAQQELKAKIKELTTEKPKINSGHKPGSIKYIRQERVKKKAD